VTDEVSSARRKQLALTLAYQKQVHWGAVFLVLGGLAISGAVWWGWSGKAVGAMMSLAGMAAFMIGMWVGRAAQIDDDFPPMSEEW